MISCVLPPALSHLRPALQLAGPARPVVRLPRTRSCSCCGHEVAVLRRASPRPLTGRRAAWPRCPVARAPRAGCCPGRAPLCGLSAAPGARAAASRSSSPGGPCPETWPAVPPGVSRRPGDAGQVPCCPGLAPSPHSPLVARARVPVDARDRVRAGCDTRPRHPTTARLPLPGHRAVGMIPAQPSPAPSPPWPGSGGAAPGRPRRLPARALAGLALAGCQCLLRAAVSPHRPSETLS